jgi:hypothetical protein
MANNTVINLEEAQKQRLEEKRREYERVLFDNMLGCYSVIEKKGLKSVRMVDISKSGMKFRMLESEGTFEIGEELAFRFYFSQDTYLPAFITIKREDRVVEDGMTYVEYGANFDKNLQSYEALLNFVEFVYQYAKHAKKDNGDKQIWFL